MCIPYEHMTPIWKILNFQQLAPGMHPYVWEEQLQYIVG